MLPRLLAAFTTARHPTHTGEGCGQGHPGGGGGSAPRGAFAETLNGPIEARAR